jgi:hypothetical protein
MLNPTHAQGLDSAAQADLFRRLLSAGICFHGYQQLSYMILSRVTPVTHSIGNCVKRVVVIVASVIAFQNPMSTQNAMGEHRAALQHCFCHLVWLCYLLLYIEYAANSAAPLAESGAAEMLASGRPGWSLMCAALS